MNCPYFESHLEAREPAAAIALSRLQMDANFFTQPGMLSPPWGRCCAPFFESHLQAHAPKVLPGKL